MNLGTFFGHGRARENAPVFKPGLASEAVVEEEIGRTHVALVRLTFPENLDDRTLDGIGQTVSQLSRLSMVPYVVVDSTRRGFSWRKELEKQIERVIHSIEHNSGTRTRRVDNLFEKSSGQFIPTVTKRKYLLQPLKQEQIPVISPIAFETDTQKLVQISADAAILALARELAGLNLTSEPGEDHQAATKRIQELQNQISLDRLIILDPAGGIPRLETEGRSHVFINLEQEYDHIYRDLISYFESDKPMSRPLDNSLQPSLESSIAPHGGGSSPKSGESNSSEQYNRRSGYSSNKMPRELAQRHLNNLSLLRQALAFLPTSSSAIITTPFDAANSSEEPSPPSQLSMVGTRRSKNPLIHNLLTDKPAYSSSLPHGRLSYPPISVRPTGSPSHTFPSASTFLKRGMPLTIIPPLPWTPSGPRLPLTSPSVDLSRLVHLIEDSFSRPLNTTNYLSRISPILAGLIIAGDYEGGAICTWEQPPLSSSDGSPRPPVPYLDKFAVLKRSQGSGGVADIVFNALVRACFPEGVCWRSRADNPVNRWYFERAGGTWRLNGTQWTMFWTGEPEKDRHVNGYVVEGREHSRGGGKERLTDYEAVCRGVVASWADTGKADD